MVGEGQEKIVDGVEGASALVTVADDALVGLDFGAADVVSGEGYYRAPGKTLSVPLGGRDDDLYAIAPPGGEAEVWVLVNT